MIFKGIKYASIGVRKRRLWRHGHYYLLVVLNLFQSLNLFIIAHQLRFGKRQQQHSFRLLRQTESA